MLSKIDRYIIGKFLGTFIFMVMIILAVSIVIDVAEKIDDFIERKPPIDKLIFSYYGNFMLFYGNLLSPICVFLAVIYFTSRLTNNTEIVAMLSAGVSFWRVMAPYMGTAVFLAGFSFYLNAYLVPVANKQRIDFEYNYLKRRTVMTETNIHKKIGYDKKTGLETMVYLYSYNQWNKEGYLFSMEVYKDDLVKKLDATKIKWNDSLKNWHLENVKVHTFFEGKEQLYSLPEMDTSFLAITPSGSKLLPNGLPKMDTARLLTPDDIYVKEMQAESMPLDELNKSIALEEARVSGLAEERIVVKYRRYAYPFAAIILTIIGFAVSTRKRRGGTPLQIGIGLVIAFAYVILVVAGEAIIGDKLPTWVAVWIPNMVFFVVAGIMLRLAPK
jgi:lipopolysaccharide export system permease protein